MANDINELRGHLFAVLRGVKDGSIEPSAAKAVCQVASEITKTAQIELQYMKDFEWKKDSAFINPTVKSIPHTKDEIVQIKGGNPLL